MTSVNKAIVMGRITKDAEIRETAGGKIVANFSVATNERWTDKSGQPQERTEFHRIAYWSPSLRSIGNLLTKGREVYIEGELRTRKFETQAGESKEVVNIEALVLKILGDWGRRESL